MRQHSVGRPAPGPPGPSLSHLDHEGAARMVDVSAKPVTAREAVARGRITIAPAAMRLVRAGHLKKGGVVEVARLAGIMAAKQTADAIPLCHPAAAVARGRGPPAAAGRLRNRGARSDRREDRRRDGGTPRGGRGGPHRLRHGQGRGQGDDDRRDPPRPKDRRPQRRLPATVSGRVTSRDSDGTGPEGPQSEQATAEIGNQPRAAVAVDLETQKAWARTWQVTGEALEKIRRAELRALTAEKGLAATDNLHPRHWGCGLVCQAELRRLGPRRAAAPLRGCGREPHPRDGARKSSVSVGPDAGGSAPSARSRRSDGASRASRRTST